MSRVMTKKMGATILIAGANQVIDKTQNVAMSAFDFNVWWEL